MEQFNDTKKRQRTILSVEQTKFLQNYFFHNTFPSKDERDEVAKKLGMPQRTIQIWFQNMRQKVKNRCNEKTSHRQFEPLYLLAKSATQILADRKRRKVFKDNTI